MFSKKVDMIITHILYPSNKEFPKEQTPSLHTRPDIERKEKKEAYFHGESGQHKEEKKKKGLSCDLIIFFKNIYDHSILIHFQPICTIIYSSI